MRSVGRSVSCAAQALDELGRRLDRHEVGLGEVAVVVGLLLRAVHGEAVGVGVVVVRRLDERLPRLVRGDLLAERRLDRAADERERVHVLDLPARPVALLPALAHRDVDVGAQRALLHLRVGNAELGDRLAEEAEEPHRLVGRAQVGFRDDLEERRTTAVEVDERVVGADRAARSRRRRGRSSRRPPRGARGRSRSRGRRRRSARRICPARTEGLELADLVALRQVGIEVVLAREDGVLGDLAVEREAEEDRHLDRACRSAPAARPGARGRPGTCACSRRAVLERAAAEHLRLRLEVAVHLEAADELPL